MKKYLLFAAALLGLVACQNNEPQNVAPRQVTLHATVDNGAANGPHRIAPVDPTAETVTFNWQEGDQVIVHTDANYTLDASNLNGNQADFVGAVGGDLSSYTVYYGYVPSEASQTIEYVENSFKPCVYGTGTNENFTLNQFFPVLKLQLTGASTLGKIEYLIGSDVKATMTITDGIALTSTASVVYLPVAGVAAAGFSLKFYDNAATPALIMEKTTTYNLTDKMGKIVTMPELEVKAGEAAKAGQAKASINGVDVDVNWVQLWENGPRWAEYNVGVTDADPVGYGDFFAWGETEIKSLSLFYGVETTGIGNFSDATDWTENFTLCYKHGLIYYSDYMWRTSFDEYWDYDEAGVLSKYNTGTHHISSSYTTALAAGTIVPTWRDVMDNKTTLELVDDAANVNWGGKWRMPTKAEYAALIANCSVTQAVVNGKRCWKFTGKETGYTDRSVYFPAAGYIMDNEAPSGVGFAGGYWTSTLNGDDDLDAYDFSFNYDVTESASVFTPSTNFSKRYMGKKVRAIYDPSLD